MKTNFSLLFYMKKQKNYTKGIAPIYMRITVNGKRAESATGRSCEPERWKIYRYKRRFQIIELIPRPTTEHGL